VELCPKLWTWKISRRHTDRRWVWYWQRQREVWCWQHLAATADVHGTCSLQSTTAELIAQSVQLCIQRDGRLGGCWHRRAAGPTGVSLVSCGLSCQESTTELKRPQDWDFPDCFTVVCENNSWAVTMLHRSTYRGAVQIAWNYVALERGAKYCDEYACLSVCLPVCLSAQLYLKNHTAELHFFCVSSAAVARSFSGGAAIRYVLPVLWMMSCFYASDPTVFLSGERAYNRWNYCIDSSQILLNNKDQHRRSTPRAKSAIYDSSM